MKLCEVLSTNEAFTAIEKNPNRFEYTKEYTPENAYFAEFIEPVIGDTIELFCEHDDVDEEFLDHGGAWYIEFASSIYGHDLANRKQNSLAVLNTICHALLDFVKLAKPGKLFFSAAEAKRQSMYLKMCNIITKSVPYTLHLELGSDFYLIRNDLLHIIDSK